MVWYIVLRSMKTCLDCVKKFLSSGDKSLLEILGMSSCNWQTIWEVWWNAGGGGTLGINQHPIQGERGVVILLVTSCYLDTGITSGWVGHKARVQTLLFPALNNYWVLLEKLWQFHSNDRWQMKNSTHLNQSVANFEIYFPWLIISCNFIICNCLIT